jgi:hypothetical protein
VIGANVDEFLFDDYFDDPDIPGIELVIPFRGKPIPFRIKRSLSLGERQKANDAAIKIDIDKNGKPHLVGQPNQAAYTREIVLAGLLEWPFKKNGKPVEITRETVAKLDGVLQEELANRILGITEVNPAVLDPSERESVGA